MYSTIHFSHLRTRALITGIHMEGLMKSVFQIHFFTVILFFKKKNFDDKFTIRGAVQHSVFLVFHTLFAIGLCRHLHISRWHYVDRICSTAHHWVHKNWKLLALYRGVSNEFCSFLQTWLPSQLSAFACLNCLGRGGSVMTRWSHA